jgi:plastocyanin
VRRRSTLPVVVTAVVALLGAAPAVATAPKKKSIEVADNYYLPAKVTVAKGAKVTWKWPDDIAIDVHDVKLKSAPKGVKKFHSDPASSGYRYTRTLKKPGKYKVICTLHEEMTMTITVKK